MPLLRAWSIIIKKPQVVLSPVQSINSWGTSFITRLLTSDWKQNLLSLAFANISLDDGQARLDSRSFSLCSAAIAGREKKVLENIARFFLGIWVSWLLIIWTTQGKSMCCWTSVHIWQEIRWMHKQDLHYRQTPTLCFLASYHLPVESSPRKSPRKNKGKWNREPPGK